METHIAVKPPKWRKTLGSSVVGGVIGFSATIGLVRLYEGGALGELGGSEIAAGATGMVYLLLALGIGIGVALPAAGARFLNFEDEEELRERRRLVALSALAMVAMGIAMCALALAGPGGSLSPLAALGIVLAMWLVATPVTVLLWRTMDELEREMSRDCGNLSFYLLFVAGGSWALLAYLGFLPGPAMLDWLTSFHVLPLAAAMIAAGRKGLLRQR